MRSPISQILLLIVMICAAARVDASVLDAVNAARHECGERIQNQLSLNKLLNTAARQASQGMRPADAAYAVGYAMTQLASIHLQGFRSDRELHSMLAQRSCKIVGDADARDAGYFQRGNEVWILIGAARGDPGDAVAASRRALALVNKARSHSRQCGDEWFAATAPLMLNPLLSKAAQAHSDEMARLRYVDHQGKDASTPATRIGNTGYAWKRVGENVAAGEGNVDLVIEDWLGSPHHCANIMDRKFTEMGIAFASNKDDQQYGVYWTQTFGTPKPAKK